MIRVPESQYSQDDLRNYDTSRCPSLLTQHFHDAAVAFQQKARESELRATEIQKNLQSLLSIPYSQRIAALTSGLVTDSETSVIANSLEITLDTLNSWGLSSFGMDWVAGNIVYSLNELSKAICGCGSLSPYTSTQQLIRALHLYFDSTF